MSTDHDTTLLGCSTSKLEFQGDGSVVKVRAAAMTLNCLTLSFLMLSCLTISCLSFFATALPAQATQVPPSAICAEVKTGVIQVLETGTCPRTMWDLGVAPVLPGTERPQKFDPVMAHRVAALQVAAKKAGFTIGTRSGWRSMNTQTRLFNAAVAKYGSAKVAHRWVLPANESMHTWGLAVDFKLGTDPAKSLKWLEANSFKYGLCRKYKNEWWHFEPTTTPGVSCPAMLRNAAG